MTKFAWLRIVSVSFASVVILMLFRTCTFPFNHGEVFFQFGDIYILETVIVLSLILTYLFEKTYVAKRKLSQKQYIYRVLMLMCLLIISVDGIAHLNEIVDGFTRGFQSFRYNPFLD
ncbi:hypothetical protein [Staphylococcus massiliensis]|uniref:hypothetical protein n=1 Tax=Staphylococcus massiliensis TaxID=555791 RepID=UPI001EDCF885|nr:hypothetical protein [Staphylococcus massiliensis]MCG3399270.1 hypothetical protein [Staphylococcus massiliensis]MCG3402340.1 hypothetical protein [Staphylococcus massiliensis]MCG3411693.1 hypothetical protein [Staphylococcus massiliensis]